MRRPQRIKAPSRRAGFMASRHSGTRAPSQIQYVCLHDTEGGTAKSVALMFHSSEAAGSAHLVVDDFESQRCLEDNQIPWAAPGLNTTGFHIEQCGFAAWSKARWMLHQPMLHRTAYKTARICHRYGIPVKLVRAAGIRAGVPGVTTHHEVTLAFPAINDHTDPGPHYPIGFVMALAQIYRKTMRG